MLTPHHTLTVDDDHRLYEQSGTFALCKALVAISMLVEIANTYADKIGEAEARQPNTGISYTNRNKNRISK